MDSFWTKLVQTTWSILKEDIWWTFLNGFCLTLALPLVLILLFGILANKIGRGLGLPLLLWVDGPTPRRFRRQFMIGLGAGVVVWQVFMAGYLTEEFASNYTIDHPPFCESRYDQLDHGITDGVYLHRFRYAPTSVASLGRYVISVVKSAAILTLLVMVFIRLAHFLGERSGEPFRKPWKPYPGRHQEVTEPSAGQRVAKVLLGPTGGEKSEVPKPPRTLALPFGFASGVVMMIVLASVLMNGSPRPYTERLGQLCVEAGGWGFQAARQERLKTWNKMIAGEQTLSPDAEAKKAQADTRSWLKPYYPLFGFFFLTFWVMFLYTLLLAYFRQQFPVLTPAGWIYFFMHVPIFSSVMLSYFVPFSGQLIQVILFGLILTAGRTYKLRFPNLPFGDEPVPLKDAYQRMVADEKPDTPTGRVAPSPYGLIRAANLPNKTEVDGRSTRPPIALVCVSGGGSRASYWTMSVLAEIERRFLASSALIGQPVAFPYHVRLVTGASGGMLAASAYTASIEAPDSEAIGSLGLYNTVNRRPFAPAGPTADELQNLVIASGSNFLDDPVHRLGSHDLWWLFFPKRMKYDRGSAIEASWRKDFGGILNRSFEELRKGEEDGWRPSLIFSPMLVEDGRQLFISNLDLQSVTRNLAYVPGGAPDSKDHGKTLLSREGIEFFKLFPEAAKDFEIGTAARMSASFPYILPAGILPTNPPRRVVDAGYYDNYGVGIAASWLVNHIEWVKANTSGVIIIQIRDGASEQSRRREIVDDPFPSMPERSMQWATSPPAGLWQSRVASNVFRNDNLIHLINDSFRMHGLDPEFLATATFELSRGEDVSLSWTLTENERNWVDHDVKDVSPRVDDVIQWWQRRLAWDQGRTRAAKALMEYANTPRPRDPDA